jgi:hypothetical protein
MSKEKTMRLKTLPAWVLLGMISAGITLAQATDPLPTEAELITQCETYKAMPNPPAHIVQLLNGVSCQQYAQSILEMVTPQ